MSLVRINGEICILAGGLSTRMGRDKARLRLHGKPLLQHVKEAARQSPWPVRVIRRDLVPRCGPLGGVFTALKTTRLDMVLFLACDMPFVSAELIGKFLCLNVPAFAYGAEGAGFPFLLPEGALSLVEEQIAARRYSLQSLANRCRARKLRAKDPRELFNVNTLEDWDIARKPQIKLRANVPKLAQPIKISATHQKSRAYLLLTGRDGPPGRPRTPRRVV